MNTNFIYSLTTPQKQTLSCEVLERKNPKEKETKYYLWDKKKKYISSLYPTKDKTIFNVDFRALGEKSYCVIQFDEIQKQINILKTFSGMPDLFRHMKENKKLYWSKCK